MKLVFISVGMMALAFAGIAIKILLKKNGKFAGTCGSQNPYINTEGENCSFCGAKPEEQCKKEDQ